MRTNNKPRDQRLAVAGCEVLVQLTCPLSLTPVSVLKLQKCYNYRGLRVPPLRGENGRQHRQGSAQEEAGAAAC